MIFRGFGAGISRDYFTVKADIYFWVSRRLKKIMRMSPAVVAMGQLDQSETSRIKTPWNDFRVVVSEDSFFAHWKLILCLCRVSQKSGL